MTPMTAIPLRREVYYPESDNTPMGETEIHVRESLYLLEAFDWLLRDVRDVYVAANMFFYYVQDDPRGVVAPDVFVAKGVPRGERRTYKLWEEGQVPCLIVEVTSDSSRDDDVVKKKALYQQLGVEEYIVHDPLKEYLEPPLQGFRLVNGRYRPIPLESDGAVRSQSIGVIFRMEGNGLRLVDTMTGETILPSQEVRHAQRAAEDEIARLRAELDRFRGQG
ncbi:MAG TPA: Uma2 family endonuclease [Thermoanaerobaculia bacterium]|nr:Uma2 family endonuclease [Thermoanaerobaculia bacterium]